MRICIFIMSVLCMSVQANVTLTEQDIKRACQQHAYKMVKDLDLKVIPLDKEKQSAAIDLANRSCLSYFARVESSSPETLDNTPSQNETPQAKQNKEESKAWYEKLIEGDQEKDTPADDRLKKRR